jgi:hypothetical protein
MSVPNPKVFFKDGCQAIYHGQADNYYKNVLNHVYAEPEVPITCLGDRLAADVDEGEGDGRKRKLPEDDPDDDADPIDDNFSLEEALAVIIAEEPEALSPVVMLRFVLACCL